MGFKNLVFFSKKNLKPQCTYFFPHPASSSSSSISDYFVLNFEYRTSFASDIWRLARRTLGDRRRRCNAGLSLRRGGEGHAVCCSGKWVWKRGAAVASSERIIKVDLRRARLVPGWVTDSGGHTTSVCVIKPSKLSQPPILIRMGDQFTAVGI